MTSWSKIYDYNLALGASHVLLDGSILFGFGHYRGSKAGEKVQFNNLSVTDRFQLYMTDEVATPDFQLIETLLYALKCLFIG